MDIAIIYKAFFDKTSYDINNKFIFTGSKELLPKNNAKLVEKIQKDKIFLIHCGFANQQDSNYIALKTLQKFPFLCRTLAKRYPVIYIDEAQDTTEIQMAIIDELSKAGLKEVMLVGDPDQNIFEWNTADPKFFLQKCREWDCIELNECRRSTKYICQFTHKLSTLSAPAKSTCPIPEKNSFAPIIYPYNEIGELIEKFLKWCNDAEINASSVAVLARSNRVINNIIRIYSSNDNEPRPECSWKEKSGIVYNLCEGRYLLDTGNFLDGYKIFERIYFYIQNPTNVATKENIRKQIELHTISEWRRKINEFVKKIPTTDCTLINWFNNLQSQNPDLPIDKNYKRYFDEASGNLLVSSVFSHFKPFKLNLPFRLGTIHSVKGETFEAVLVVLQKNAARKRYRNLILKNNLGKNELQDEELRTVYVGITRPKKLLMVGIPNEDKEVWSELFNIDKTKDNPHIKS